MDFIERDDARDSVDRDIESAEREREDDDKRDLVDSENTKEGDEEVEGLDMIGDENEPQPTE